jgi:hypothetical protein
MKLELIMVWSKTTMKLGKTRQLSGQMQCGMTKATPPPSDKKNKKNKGKGIIPPLIALL